MMHNFDDLRRDIRNTRDGNVPFIGIGFEADGTFVMATGSFNGNRSHESATEYITACVIDAAKGAAVTGIQCIYHLEAMMLLIDELEKQGGTKIERVNRRN